MEPFNVVLADPPWQFTNVKTGGSHTSGAAQQYGVLDVHALIALDGLHRYEQAILGEPKVLAQDCVLALWSPVAMLPEALSVMRMWGFTFKTTLHWHKTGRYGTGYWFRGEVEHLLIGIKGKVPAFRSPQRNWVESPGDDWLLDEDPVDHKVLKHSEKPEIFRTILDAATARVMPSRRCLELFARRLAVGWTCTGLELDGLDVTRPKWYEYLALPFSERCERLAEEADRARAAGQAAGAAEEADGAGGEPE